MIVVDGLVYLHNVRVAALRLDGGNNGGSAGGGGLDRHHLGAAQVGQQVHLKM